MLLHVQYFTPSLLLNIIPLHKYATISLSIHLLLQMCFHFSWVGHGAGICLTL